MGTGKQLSFAFGEVSPSLRFRSNAAYYGQALAALSNGFVKKAGGVSNRSGTIFNLAPTNQEYLSNNNTTIGVRIFPLSFVISGVKTNYILEMRDRVFQSTKSTDGPFTLIAENGGELRLGLVGLDNGDIVFNEPSILDLTTAVLTQLNNSAIITVSEIGGNIQRMFEIVYDSAYLSGTIISKPTAIGSAGVIPAATLFGLAPFDIPVSYKVMQEQTDGSEVFWQSADFPGGGHPHSQLSISITIDASPYLGVKQYNIYRSAGVGGHFALVGRVPPSSASSIFKDFLTVEDITVQPPTDDYLYPDLIPAISNHIRKVAYYKQRTIIAYSKYREPTSTRDKYSEGQLGASKLGSPRMFGRPLTPNNIDAFSFTVPTEKLSEITNMLVMNRLIIFTNTNAFAIRGGVGGVLTPNEINPETIYTEGCTPEVTPAVVGNTGFFISTDKSKLLMITYNRDDSVTVEDVSAFSDHLFKPKNIVQMVASPGNENIVWLLKKDGTLVSLTTSIEGTIRGFSRHETEGYIESICVQDAQVAVYPSLVNSPKQYVPTLFISVIRNGIRYYERLANREDEILNKMVYADSATVFGTIPVQVLFDNPASQPFKYNITTATDFLGGSLLTITNVGFDTGSDNFDNTYVGKVVDFFYDVYDVNGKITSSSKRRLTITQFISSTVVKATCLEDIPAELQNINAQALTAQEKARRLIKFSYAVKIATGLSHLANKAVSVFADGAVISSPNNPYADHLIVSGGGTLDLGDYYDYGYVGLPYTMDLETLNLESSTAKTFVDQGKLINELGIGLGSTMGGFMGAPGITDLTNMEQIVLRDDEGIENTTKPFDGYVTSPFPGKWEMFGRIAIKQVDPLPMSVLSVYPKGLMGD